MKKINKILVPTDFSESANNALLYAIWFAQKCNAGIEVLHVIYPEAEPLDFPVMVTRATEQKMEVAKEIAKKLVETSIAKMAAEYSFDKTLESKVEIKIGVPSTLIAETARRDGQDLIIMGTQGEHSTFVRIFGSVTTATLRKAECPVLVIPENFDSQKIHASAYATDLGEADPFHIWDVGKFLEPFSPILRVVHVEKDLLESKPLEMNDLEFFFKDRAPSLQVTFHNLLNKKVVEELTDFTDIWDIDLLIMYKPKRAFFDRLFHSSMSIKMAFASKIPLMVFK